MDIKDLPRVGLKFSLKTNLPGRKSFQSKLTRLTRKNYHYRNLDSADVSTLVNILDKPTLKKSIRLKGGLNPYQIRKVVKPALYREWRAKGNFTKEDLRDELRIVKSLTRAEQQKMSGSKRTQIQRAPTTDDLSRKTGSVGSISQVMRRPTQPLAPSNIGSKLPPRIPLVR